MSERKIYFDAPARFFEEALPMGNGKLGAMIYGGVQTERIALNYDELWTGFPRDENRDGALNAYLKARDLAYAGKLKTAQRLIEKEIASANVQSYQPAGALVLTRETEGERSAYSRSLDLATAVAGTDYLQGETRHTAVYCVSAPQKCLAARFTSSVPGGVSFRLAYDCPLRYETGHSGDVFYADAECRIDSSQNRDSFPERNRFYGERDDERGIRFRVAVQVVAENGNVSVSDAGVSVVNADAATLYCSIESSFAGYDRHPFLNGKEYRNAAVGAVKEAAAVPFEALLARHKADYARYFDRVSFELEGEDRWALPTPERLKRFAEDHADLGLYPLLFDFARYLTICGSRPGSEPLNLQGIWNEKVDPPWCSDYTVNINTEMNYFPTLVTDLPEMQEPLTRMLRELSERGRETAKKYYGARGFCLHHNTDLWRACQPVHGSASWLFWPMAGGWLCRHLYEQYEYTEDLTFLRDTAFPIMKSAALFYLDCLTPEKDGYLIFAPSTSPEHQFRWRGGSCSVSLTTTMTMSIIRELFENVTEAARLIGETDEDLAAIAGALPKLLPIRIGRDGRIMEWYDERPDHEVHHRHISHLYGLYPARLITPDKTPALAEAARRTLTVRGDDATGWSLGWKINFWARLYDGDHALRLLDMQLRPIPADPEKARGLGGGTYPNLFDAHPPFQIDGNFGAGAGIAEMLMQSDGETIRLLPALPQKWASGSVKGLRAKGGAKVDITWKDGRITDYAVRGGSPRKVILCR